MMLWKQKNNEMRPWFLCMKWYDVYNCERYARTFIKLNYATFLNVMKTCAYDGKSCCLYDVFPLYCI